MHLTEVKLLATRFGLLTLIAAPVFGTSIFYSTNGATTPTFTAGNSWTASSVIAGSVVSVEMQFVSGLSGAVASIVAPLSGDVSNATFVLRTDLSGAAGTIIDTFTFSGITGSIQLLTASSMNNAALTSGTTYWLEALAPTPAVTTQSVSWYYSATPTVTGNVEVENPVPGVSTGQTISAFAVLGADVPEPATLGTAALAFTLLVLLYRRQLARFARRGD
ncbi:MAG TPA: hypothetical protein VEU96_24610 [Bryobacteraceae bacterium]|nr:hypothetical protein [Bryobacteraceae bacterium]